MCFLDGKHPQRGLLPIFLDCDTMLPKIQSLAKQQGVTVESKPSTELMHNSGGHPLMKHTSEYKEIKSIELKFPGQYEMTCTDDFGKILSKETSFSLPVFETWIISDRCSPTIMKSKCYQPGEVDFYNHIPGDNTYVYDTDIFILEV